MKRSSISCVMRELQIKITMRYLYTFNRMDEMKEEKTYCAKDVKQLKFSCSSGRLGKQ